MIEPVYFMFKGDQQKNAPLNPVGLERRFVFGGLEPVEFASLSSSLPTLNEEQKVERTSRDRTNTRFPSFPIPRDYAFTSQIPIHFSSPRFRAALHEWLILIYRQFRWLKPIPLFANAQFGQCRARVEETFLLLLLDWRIWQDLAVKPRFWCGQYDYPRVNSQTSHKGEFARRRTSKSTSSISCYLRSDCIESVGNLQWLSLISSKIIGADFHGALIPHYLL